MEADAEDPHVNGRRENAGVPRRAVTGAQVVARMEAEMDRLHMETSVRDKIAHFAALQRRCLELHVPPEQRRRLAAMPLPRRTVEHIPAATWTRTRQEQGAMRFIAQHVGLHNMAEAELRASGADPEASDLARRSAGIALPPLQCVEGSAPVRALRAEPPGWRRELASYAGCGVPRAMDRTMSQRALAGAAVSDVIRAQTSMA